MAKTKRSKKNLPAGRQTKRPGWDVYFLGIVKEVGKRATCDRGKSGCVVVKDKRILTTGYVGAPTGLPHCDEVGHMLRDVLYPDGSVTKHCIRTAHAEQNAICQAARFGIALEGATFYCKMEPCFACAKMIVNTGARRVVCEKRYHAGEDTRRLFKQANIELVVLSDKIEKYEGQR